MVRRIGGGCLVAIVVSACAPAEPWVSGTLRLADDVDPSMYTHLELRVFPRDSDIPIPDTTEPDDEPVLSQTIELDGLELPHDFVLSGEELYEANHGSIFAWMTARSDSRWWEPGELFGVTPYEMCECATHTPAHADDVVVTLEVRL